MRDKHLHIPADSQLLQQLRKAVKQVELDPKVRNRHLGIKFGFYVLLSLGFYVSLFVVQAPAWFTATFVAYGLSVLLLAFNFAHDCSHGTVFPSKRSNHLAFIALYTLVGAHAEEWKKRHVHSHHFAPNVEEYDTDLQITGIIRVSPYSPRKWFHRFQHFYAPLAYTSYSLFWVFIKDAIVYTHSRQESLRYHLSFWAQKLFYLTYLLVLPLLFSSQGWTTVLLAFFLMHLTQSIFLLFTFFMTHHVESTAYPTTDEEGQIQSSWVMNQISSSNDMHPFSETANFILGGFNNHIAHHLFPHIHHYHYPALNRVLYAILQEHGIEPNQTSYWGGIVSHLRLLKAMGRPSQKYNTEIILE